MSPALIRNQATLFRSAHHNAGPPGGIPIAMTRLLITRGLPGSGKTTFARTLQPLVTRVSRDDLRRMLHGRIMLTGWAEAQVTAVQRGMVETLLRRGADVIVDDTNLRPGVVKAWRELAAACGAGFEPHDFTDVPLDECIRRDATRPADVQVGAAAIRRMYERYLAGRRGEPGVS